MARKPHIVPITFWHATISTAHFTFDAFAPTKREVEMVMRKTFDAHCKQYGTDDGWPTGKTMWADYSDGIRYSKVELGGGCRDNVQIYSLLED